MLKIISSSLSMIIMFLFFIYEYMFRGYKVLIKGEELTLFPDSMYKLIFKLLSKKEIPYNAKRQKLWAYSGIFISGALYALIACYAVGFFRVLSS